MSKKPTNAPAHLSTESKELWFWIVENFDLEPFHLSGLLLGLEAKDRAAQARALLDKEGISIEDRWGQKKIHPAWKVFNDAQNAYRVQMRELGLDIEVPENRGPRRPGTA